MSSVSPTSEYSYAVKDLGDLEDDLQDQAKAAEKRRDEQVADIEQSYMRDLRKKDGETQQALQDMRDSASETLSNERKNSREELDRLKAQTYDRFARYHGDDAETLKQNLDDLQQAYSQDSQKHKERLAEVENAADRKMHEFTEETAAKTGREIKAAHDSALETYHNATRDYDARIDAMKKEHDAERERLAREASMGHDFETKRAESAIRDKQAEFDDRLQGTEEAYQDRLHKLEEASAEREEASAAHLHASHQDEDANLRKQVKDVLQLENQYAREKGKGTADAIKEYENNYRMERDAANSAYEANLEKMRQEAKDSDIHYAHVNDENLREKDQRFAKTIRSINNENRDNIKTLQGTYETQAGQLREEMKHNEKQADKLMDEVRERSAHDKESALESQATAYEDTMTRQKAQDNSEIDRLQKHIHDSQTGTNLDDITPAAEAAIRNSAMREYRKSLDAEQKRNKDSEESMRRSYSERMEDALNDKGAQLTDNIQREVASHHSDNRKLLDEIDDTERSKDAALHERDTDNERQTEQMLRGYSRALEQQKREYDEIMRAQQQDAEARLEAFRQESDHNAKMAEREAASHSSEIVREYEKKLNDQHAQFDDQIQDVKQTADAEKRELDRKNKVLMDDQARSFQQRIAQLEYQGKERERSIAESYETELDKMRQTNAALSRKKG